MKVEQRPPQSWLKYKAFIIHLMLMLIHLMLVGLFEESVGGVGNGWTGHSTRLQFKRARSPPYARRKRRRKVRRKVLAA